MRIGIFDPYLDTLSGGEKYILSAALCYAKNNQVDIFWDDETILEKAKRKLQIDLTGIGIKRNIFSSKYSSAKRLLTTKKYDLLLILSDGSIPATLAKKTFLHFQFPVEWVRGGDLKTKIKLLKIDRVICNSEYTKKFIDRKFKVDSEVIYPPCVSLNELADFSERDIYKKKENSILTVGRYSKLSDGSSVKKLEVMISAFKKMIDGGLKNWEFVCVVSYLPDNADKVHELETQLADYPIKILKNIDHDNLNDLYCRSKIYWHAAGFGEDLKINPELAEHFGITTVEAMSHKVVPVVIARGGQTEIVDDGINGFLWEDESELLERTKKLMIDSALLEQMAGLGIKKAKEYTLDNFCLILNKLIE